MKVDRATRTQSPGTGLKKKRCAGCGQVRRTFQKGLCADCLLPSMREGQKILSDFGALLRGEEK